MLSSTLLCPYSNSTDCRSAHCPAYACECVHRRPHICRLYSLQVCTRDSCTGCLHIVQGARIAAYAGECLRYLCVCKFAQNVQLACNIKFTWIVLTICPHMPGNALDMLSANQGAAQCTCSSDALKLQVTSQI